MRHQNYQLLIHGSELEIPTNWNRKYPNVGCGAFNQLYQIINAIAVGHITMYENDTYIGPFCKDHQEGSIVPISLILNLEEMNRIYGFKFIDCLNYQEKYFLNWYHPHGVFLVHWETPLQFAESCKKIIFSDTLKNSVHEAMKEKDFLGIEANVAHIRFADNFAREVFNNLSKSRDLETLEESCIRIIHETCTRELPLFLLTHDKTHPAILKLSEDYNVIFIEAFEYEKHLPESCANGRDIISVCDVIACHNLRINNFIYQENSDHVSSFSIFIKNTANYKNCYPY